MYKLFVVLCDTKDYDDTCITFMDPDAKRSSCHRLTSRLKFEVLDDDDSCHAA